MARDDKVDKKNNKEETQCSQANVEEGELKCVKGCMAGTPGGCPKSCVQPMTGCLCNQLSLWQGSVLFVIFDLIWAIINVVTTLPAIFKSSFSFWSIIYIIIAVCCVAMLIGAICGAFGLFKNSAGLFRKYVQIYIICTIILLICAIILIFHGSFFIVSMVFGLFWRWWMVCVTNSQANAMERGETGKAPPGKQLSEVANKDKNDDDDDDNKRSSRRDAPSRSRSKSSRNTGGSRNQRGSRPKPKQDNWMDD